MATPRINSVNKAFEILRAFSPRQPEMSAAEIAARTGMTAATVHRFLLTLEDLGALARTEANRYRLGLLVADLGNRVEQDKVLAGSVRPHIDILVAEFRESVDAAVLSGDEVVVVASGEAARSLRIGGPVGRVLAAHCSAAGKVLLAGLAPEVLNRRLADGPRQRFTARTITEQDALRVELARIRDQGFAVDDEEWDEGLRSVAVPIPDGHGHVRAALAISGPVSRMDWDRVAQYRAALARHAHQIAQAAMVESKVLPDKARPRGSFPHVKRVGDFVLVSGTSARRPDDSFEGVSIEPSGQVRLDIRRQTAATLDNVRDILGSVGIGLDAVIGIDAFLVDMADYAGFNQVYVRYFGADGPTRTTVAVAQLPHPHQALMIKAMAYKPIDALSGMG